jgi:hypothetical protein
MSDSPGKKQGKTGFRAALNKHPLGKQASKYYRPRSDETLICENFITIVKYFSYLGTKKQRFCEKLHALFVNIIITNLYSLVYSYFKIYHLIINFTKKSPGCRLAVGGASQTGGYGDSLLRPAMTRAT